MDYVEKEETLEKIRNGVEKLYIGFQEVTCHLIFDVKMGFSIKSWVVENGAMTEAPLSLTYSYIISRDSVCLSFLISELNLLDIIACDGVNAYLNASC